MTGQGLRPFDVFAWVAAAKARNTEDMLAHVRIWEDSLLVKLFDGPTPEGRSDFHINTSPEWFLQLEGELYCRVFRDGAFEEIVIGPGEMFLLPPLLPHLNRRPRGSIGLVIHQPRAPGALDSVAWYCERCTHQLHRVDYWFESLLDQLPPLVRAFLADESLRTCGECGWVMPADQGCM